MQNDIEMNEMRRNDDAMKNECLYQNNSVINTKVKKMEKEKRFIILINSVR